MLLHECTYGRCIFRQIRFFLIHPLIPRQIGRFSGFQPQGIGAEQVAGIEPVLIRLSQFPSWNNQVRGLQPCNVEGLTAAGTHHQLFPNFLERPHCGMNPFPQSQIPVYLIADDNHPIGFTDVCQSLQLFSRPYPADRIVRTAKQQYSGSLSARLLQLFIVHAVTALVQNQVIFHQFPARCPDNRIKRVIDRRLHNHFCVLLRKRLYGIAHCRNNAAGRHNPF